MKQNLLILTAAILLVSSCTSQKKLAYLNNLPEKGGEQYFPMDYPDYKIQNRDILYITAKTMNPTGNIVDILKGPEATSGISLMESESSIYLNGYDVKTDGDIILPIIGKIHVEGKTLEETRKILQEEANKRAAVKMRGICFMFFGITVCGVRFAVSGD